LLALAAVDWEGNEVTVSCNALLTAEKNGGRMGKKTTPPK